jgi:cytochrome c556
MKRLMAAGIVLALVIVGSLMTNPADAQKDRTPTVKEIMGKLHKGANAPLTTIRADLQMNPPDWKEIQQAAKDFVTFGEALTKNNPPKGDKKSWDKFAAQYVENAKALDKAAQGKDQKAALAAHTRLNDSCKSCHGLHRPG